MSYNFDKFIKDITRREDEQREKLKKYAEEHADTPARRYNELYRELWQNRITYGEKNDEKK